MAGIMSGIRVLEVASWTYVPMAGGVLAEWGADVLKIEHPEGGDPQRGLVSSGLMPGGGGVNFAIVYGFGLIVGAFVLAVIYMFLCKPEPDDRPEMTEIEIAAKAVEEEGQA